jgi:hypothetical protein
MTIEKAELIAVEPLDCTSCLLADQSRPCSKVVEAVVNAAVKQDPTVDVPKIGTEDRINVAINLLHSLKYQEAAQLAGELACKSNQQFYNRTATQSLLTVMI